MITKTKPGFSLIEVLFAITFLVLVGAAMATLNNTASRLTTASELKETALALNEQSISFVALEKRTKINPTFASAYPNCVAGQTCYVSCPAVTSTSCVLQTTKSAVTIGSDKLQFTTAVVIRPTGANGRFLVNATVSWGAGVTKQSSLARVIE